MFTKLDDVVLDTKADLPEEIEENGTVQEGAPSEGEVLPPEDEDPINAITVESIRHSCDVLSLEAFAGLNALKSAIDRLPNLFSKAGRFFKSKFNLFSKQPKALFSAHGLENAYKKADQKSYANLQHIVVHAPEGLQVSLLKYTRLLKKQADTASKLLPDVINPYNNWLGQVVENPSILAQNTSRLNIEGFQNINFEPIEKEIQACFVTHGQRTNRVHYSKAFERNQDLLELSKELDEMSNLFSSKMHQEILDKNLRMSELLNGLIEVVETNKGGLKVSSTTIKALADTTYHTARLMEQYGLLRFRLLELDHSVKETVNIIKRNT